MQTQNFDTIETIVVGELLNILDDILGDYRNHYPVKGQISYDCPVCSANKGISHDGKGNLEVNYRKGVYKCWACGDEEGTKGSIGKLIRKYGTKEHYSRFIGLDLDFDYRFVAAQDEQREIFIPNEAILLTTNEGKKRGRIGYDYLISRGITDEMVDQYTLFFIPDGKYHNRILIPSYNYFDELEYFVTRSIIPKSKLKYLNPNINKESIIFNESMINWNEPITLLEGVFDHMVVPNSIPLLGKNLYELLFNKIYSKAKNNIYIALDGDAYSQAKSIYRKLDTGRLKGKIYIIPIPKDTDISEINQNYGIDGLRKIFKKAKRLID